MSVRWTLAVSILLLGCGSSSTRGSTPDDGGGRDSGSPLDATGRLDAPGEAADARAPDVADAGVPKDAAPLVHYGDFSDPTLWQSVAWPQTMDFDSTVFDGQYVYFGQYGDGYGGEKVFRYDTTSPFTTKSSWSFVEVMQGYISTVGPAAFAGGVVYFAGDYAFGEEPVEDQSLILSYAPASSFVTKSWVTTPTDTCSVCGYGNSTAGSDGKHAYFAIGGDFSQELLRLGESTPETIDLRTDGGTSFPQPTATAFAGTHVYFSAGRTGYRIATSAPFELASLETFDPATLVDVEAGSVAFVRVAFDGRYVYLVPTYSTAPFMVRYDTTKPWGASGSWSDLDLTTVLSPSWALNAVAFDGRYLYLIGQGGTPGLQVSVWRYDTTAPWDSGSSWSLAPTAVITTPAISAASFDGQYLYFVNEVGVWRFRARDAGPLPSFLPGGTLN